MIHGVVHSVTVSGAFLMTSLNSLWSEVISEHIDSVNGLARKTMLHVSSINSLEHISLIFHGKVLVINGKKIFENCVDYFSGDQ